MTAREKPQRNANCAYLCATCDLLPSRRPFTGACSAEVGAFCPPLRLFGATQILVSSSRAGEYNRVHAAPSTLSQGKAAEERKLRVPLRYLLKQVVWGGNSQ
jgi:hypothetical protein